MKWSELDATAIGGCKEHPNDKHLPGVCSSCLRDKLSQLYKKNPIDPIYNYYPSPSSPASPKTFSSVNDDSSNDHDESSAHRRRFHRNASHAIGSASCMISFNYGLNLKKSRSLVFVSRKGVKERDVVGAGGGGRGRKKDGFWSKVLKLKRKDSDESVVSSISSRT